jgi:hypothetical protein
MLRTTPARNPLRRFQGIVVRVQLRHCHLASDLPLLKLWDRTGRTSTLLVTILPLAFVHLIGQGMEFIMLVRLFAANKYFTDKRIQPSQ